MGYPMTWQRVLSRNALGGGTYETAPDGWALLVNTELIRDEYPHLADRLTTYERQAKMLAGDLRRLEKDGQDERAVCLDIERRTGIKREIVATVMKEFFHV